MLKIQGSRGLAIERLAETVAGTGAQRSLPGLHGVCLHNVSCMEKQVAVHVRLCSRASLYTACVPTHVR